MNLSVASLHVYPIKSLGGFYVDTAELTDRGFKHDRRWMLVDEQLRFLSQREIAAMACLHCSPITNGFRVTDLRDGSSMDLPWMIDSDARVSGSVWDDAVELVLAPSPLSDWFSQKLSMRLSLAYMPSDSIRPTDQRYAKGITSLSDGFPYLIISHASLDDLNARIEEPIPMERFRPNIVIGGGRAFQEDGWKEITIGAVRFSLVKPCSRCVITTIDQNTGQRGKEPLRTLASYRKRVAADGSLRVDFGMNAMGPVSGIVDVGDTILLPA